MDSKNTKYLILTIILLILSGFGVFLVFKINSSPLSLFLNTTEVIVTPTPINTELTEVPTEIPKISITPIATVTGKIASPSPTKKPTITITPTATPTAKLTPTVTPSPTSNSSSLLNFSSSEDGFSVSYSSLRKLYQDKESTGNRYTFYSLSGNFAVHVASSGTWAWTNTDRNFSAALIVSGKNTYRYDIATQTIVDLQSSTKNYTLQCIHNGKESLKAECEAFIKSFQLL
ncbi:MAG: hypothetical protein PHE71_03090 [Candidatus Shapirobacteria bacterium]|nr:hypothetical protein [Candidatus Shapirobacteria bacterium]